MHTTDRTLVLRDPDQIKALGHPVRTRILTLLDDRPRSAKELAEALEMTPGRIGHHLKTLERAGLVEVVSERPVRAVVERFYGPTHHSIRLDVPGVDRLRFALNQAAMEAAGPDTQPIDDGVRLVSNRIPTERAEEFASRLADLAAEFAAEPSDTDADVFSLLAAVYRVDVTR